MDLIISVVLNLVWIAFWFWVGSKIFQKLKGIKEKETVLSSESILSQQIKKVPILTTEMHQGIIFAFKKADDSFVAQGSTIDEVAEATHKYMKIDLAFISHQGEDYWVVNGKITKSNLKLV